MSEEERTPQELAREWNAELHGMTDERWDAYLRYLEGENRDELAEVSKRLLEEAKELHALLQADKIVTPENREQRRQLSRGLRELRARRLNDIRARYEAPYDEGDDPVMSKEDRRRARRARGREREVQRALRKLRFLRSRGFPLEVDEAARIGVFLDPGGAAAYDERVRERYEDLHQMHKNNRERDILLEAWERFQDEEY